MAKTEAFQAQVTSKVSEIWGTQPFLPFICPFVFSDSCYILSYFLPFKQRFVNMSGTQIPTLKVDSGALDAHVKLEDVASPSPSAVSDTYMDDADLDDPELDFKQAYQNLWLSKLPKHLWETLAKLGDDDEIEIGTIRVEGSMDTPHRVSLKLNEKSPLFQSTEKEYILKAPDQSHRRIKRPGQVMMFSEKDKAGYKKRANVWDNIDEDGNPGQGRSQLYENIQKDEKKKENKGKPWQYRPRKPIPKITALAGTVSQEFEAVAVENAEHKRLEQQRTQDLLRPKEKDSIKIGKVEAKTQYASVISSAERSRINAVRLMPYYLWCMLTICRRRTSRESSSKTIVLLAGPRKLLLPSFSRNSASIGTGV